MSVADYTSSFLSMFTAADFRPGSGLFLLMVGGLLVMMLAVALFSTIIHTRRSREHAQELEWINMALRESEDEARSIVETAHDAYIGIDAHSYILEWNPKSEETFGWARDEVLGRDVIDLLIPERDRVRYKADIQQFLKTGKSTILNNRVEINVLHRTGTEFPVEMTMWAVKTGPSYKFNAFLHDISDRRMATRRIAAQTAAAAALVEATTIDDAAKKVLRAVAEALGWDVGILWILEKDKESQAHTLHCVDEWCRDGVSAEHFIRVSRATTFTPGMGLPGRVLNTGRPLWIADVAKDPNFPRVEAAMEAGLHAAFGFPLLNGAGPMGVVEFFSSDIQSPDPDLLGMMDTVGSLLGQFLARRQVEDVLERERQFLDVLLNNLTEGIVACDENGTLTVFNRASREIHGTPEEPLPPDQWAQHYNLYMADGKTPIPTEQIPLFRALHGEKVRDVEIVVIPDDTTAQVLVCNGQDLRDADGRKMGAVVAMHDITQRKRDQEDLERSRNQLKEKEQRLAEAQRIAHIGSWEMDVETKKITWSDELYRLYRLEPGHFEPTLDSWMEYIHSQDRDAVKAMINHAIEHQQPFQFKYRVILPDGSMAMQQAQGRVIVDEKGRALSVMGTGQDITDINEAQEQLLRLANFDPLTGLLNRRQFYDCLRKSIAQADEQHWMVAVLFLDLDRFKVINDTMGHIAGDELLRQVGNRIKHSLRQHDIVGRLGGDEFAITMCLPDDPQVAAQTAKHVIETMEEPFLIDGQEVNVTTSIGITVYPTDSADLDTLVHYADTAMYEAKSAGRGTYRFYTQEMNIRAMEKIERENALRKAVECQEFELHYQPKVAIGSGELTGVEALLRWNRPGNGVIQPEEFVHTLEEMGLIIPVGHWVILEACRQFAQWRDAGLHVPVMAVNVSARQLAPRPHFERDLGSSSNPDVTPEFGELAAAVQHAIADFKLQPNQLELELTETTLMSNAPFNVALLKRLKDYGAAITVDDFGTGYSSLAYLKRFPIDALKIDRSFVHDLAHDAEDAAIVTAIITVAHALNMRVIAEGVETATQLGELARRGCDEMQGYYIHTPMNAEAFGAWVSHGMVPAWEYVVRD